MNQGRAAAQERLTYDLSAQRADDPTFSDPEIKLETQQHAVTTSPQSRAPTAGRSRQAHTAERCAGSGMRKEIKSADQARVKESIGIRVRNKAENVKHIREQRTESTIQLSH